MSGLDLDSLRELPGVLDIEGEGSVRVTGVQSDSRQVVKGDLFAAIAGARADGASFAQAAIKRGAVAVLSTRAFDLTVPIVICDDVRRCLGLIAHEVYRRPTHELKTVGITGTNGKTTVSYLLESVLTHAGCVPAMLGTVALRGPAGEREAELTTPEADTIARFTRKQRDAGATHFVMEVSSHALEQGRSLGVRFDVAAFTNLTQDHLDYHGTMASYGEAKARLFDEYAPEHSVIMVDAPFGRELATRAKGKVWRCSRGEVADAELCVREWSSTRSGLRALVATPEGDLTIESPLFGAHNLENVLVTLGCALALGIAPSVVAEALKDAAGAPGRMERVVDPRGVLVLVDYAHTPDALLRALEALRPLTPGRLFVVCGCGGDRDKKKRAPMGEAAALHADVAVLTSDNPRTEDPQAILDQMAAGALATGMPRLDRSGLSAAARGVLVIVDREQAIRATLEAAQAGDTVLLAGKGHETYQILGTAKVPFDDRAQALNVIAALVGH